MAGLPKPCFTDSFISLPEEELVWRTSAAGVNLLAETVPQK